MNIELQIIDETLSNKELKEIIDDINKIDVNKVCLLPCHVAYAKKFLDKNKKISCAIDFPFGIMSTNERSLAVNNCIRHGATSIDIVCPSYMISNKTYTNLKKDIEKISDICISKKVDLTYMLEYRSFTYDSLYRVCKILLSNNLNDVYISTGYKLDDIYDHMIAIAMIEKKISNINITPNANIFNDSHKSLIKSSKIDKIRVNNIHSVRLLS